MYLKYRPVYRNGGVSLSHFLTHTRMSGCTKVSRKHSHCDTYPQWRHDAVCHRLPQKAFLHANEDSDEGCSEQRRSGSPCAQHVHFTVTIAAQHAGSCQRLSRAFDALAQLGVIAPVTAVYFA
jgi:hypothetical protein